MGIVPPKLLSIFPRPRTSQDPKEDHPSQNSEGMSRVLISIHCQRCGEEVGEGEESGHICLDPWLGVGRESHNQSAHSDWMKRHHGMGRRFVPNKSAERRPPQSIGALIRVGDELPISQYTGQPYDPAWSVWVGGGDPPAPSVDRRLIGREP